MPTLMLRAISADLVARIKAYAEQQKLGYAPAAIKLIEIGLDHLAARSAGASVVNASRTPAERSAAAKHAVSVRETKRAAERKDQRVE